MKTIINWIKHWLGLVKPAVTDEHCPYCHGLGYDSSGYTCTCLREKAGLQAALKELGL